MSKHNKKPQLSGGSSGAIDPKTGQPYYNPGQVYSTNGAFIQGLDPSQFPWAMQGQSQFQGDYDRSSGQTSDMYGYFDKPAYDPTWMRSLGYNGSPEGFERWAQSQGMNLGMSQQHGGGFGNQDLLRLQAFKNGQTVGGEHNWTKDEHDSGFGLGMALMSLFGGQMAMAASAAGGAGSGVSAVTPGEFGELGYGPGGQGATGFSMGGANGQLLDPSAYQGLSSGMSPTPTAGALDGAFGGVSPVQGGEFGELGYGGAPGYAAPTNAATIESSLGTPGYGASSAGAGGGATGISSSASMLDQIKQFMPSMDASSATSLAKLLGGGVGTSLAGLGAAAMNNSGGKIGVPDYMGAANSQALSGRTDQTNPYGSLTYTQTGVDAQGNPVYSQNVSLNPQGQANLTSAQQAQGTALGGWNDVLKSMGIDWEKIPGIYGDAASQENLVNQSRDAMYSQQARYLDPQYQQQQNELISRLANQGVTMGSQAYTTAMDNFARQRDSAYGNARDSSINQGNQFANQLFGQGLQAHQSGVNDWLSHLTGAGGAATTAGQNANSFNPTFAQTPAPTNFLGAAALQGQGNLNQYNANTGAQNSFNNGLFNLGGSVLSNPSWTDLIGSFFKP